MTNSPAPQDQHVLRWEGSDRLGWIGMHPTTGEAFASIFKNRRGPDRWELLSSNGSWYTDDFRWYPSVQRAQEAAHERWVSYTAHNMEEVLVKDDEPDTRPLGRRWA